MTAEKDPRIEAVAKLLFTSPIYQHNAGDWETDRSDYYYDRRMCLMAAEDVLRGIDEAAEWEYAIETITPGRLPHIDWRNLTLAEYQALVAKKNAEDEKRGYSMRARVVRRLHPGPWEPLP